MRRVYYGWYVVLMAMLVLMAMVGVTVSSFGVFVVPVSADLGLSRADMNSAMILTSAGAAVASPLIGRLVDRLPIKAVLVASAVCVGGSLVALGLSRSLLLSAAILAGPLAFGVTGAGTLSMSLLIARWFETHRGRAMALALMGMSLGSVATAPLVGMLVERIGWRHTLLVCGCALGALLLLMFLLVRDRPGPDDVEDRTPRAGAPPPPAAERATAGSILRTSQFWTLVTGAALGNAVGQSVLVSLPPLALATGYAPAQATGLVTLFGAGAITGALMVAALADRLDRAALLAAILAALAIMNGAPLLSTAYPVLMLTAAAAGFAVMSISPLVLALLADRFGYASFGTAQGLMSPVLAVVSAVSVRFAGEVFDRTGGYDLMFAAFVVIEAVAAVLIFSTRFFPSAASPRTLRAT